MRKTTVYVPDGVHAQPARAAVESERSEADLIRDGIEVVGGDATPGLPLFESDDPKLAERVHEHLTGFGER